MLANFRLTMTWVHTWFGLVLGFVLMVCFFFGALSVFDREIDRWAIPETRFPAQPMPSFDRVLKPIFERIEPHPDSYNERMPSRHDPSKGPMTPRLELKAGSYSAYTTHRDPVLGMGAQFLIPHPKDPDDNRVFGNVTIDPRNGDVVSDDALKIGSRWFYPMHYSLHLRWKDLGIWIAGLAALVMLAALVTGVIIHRKVFREFFTFRPWKRTQRSALDLHNLTGVVALPFHFFFALSAMTIFAGIYLPIGHTMLKPMHDRNEAIESQRTGLPHERSGVPGSLGSVDAMVTEAKRRWAARDIPGEVGFLRVHHLGDAASYVSIYRAGSDRVALVGEGIHFKASSGELLHEDPPRSVAADINEFLTGLHLQHFRHWLLRWLYVLGGLAGCVCVATGFMFFVEKRKQQHAKTGGQGSRVVDALAVATVTGIVLAAVAILVVNRILPGDLAGKDEWEKAAFWGAWILAFVHAAVRSAPVALGKLNPAWREQCWAIAALAPTAVLLNWLTTGDHLIKTLSQPYWPVAGLDLALLLAGGIAGFAALKLKRRAARDDESGARLEPAIDEGDDAIEALPIPALPAGATGIARTPLSGAARG